MDLVLVIVAAVVICSCCELNDSKYLHKKVYTIRHPEFKIFLDAYNDLAERYQRDYSAMNEISRFPFFSKDKESQEVYSSFLKDAKKMQRCKESFCEANADILADAYNIFEYDFDYIETRWAEIARAKRKMEQYKQKGTEETKKNIWSFKKK